MAQPVNNITFNGERKIDELLLLKLNAVAPYFYDDPTGTARKLLHQKLDEVIQNLGIDIYCVPTQSARAG